MDVSALLNLEVSLASAETPPLASPSPASVSRVLARLPRRTIPQQTPVGQPRVPGGCHLPLPFRSRSARSAAASIKGDAVAANNGREGENEVGSVVVGGSFPEEASKKNKRKRNYAYNTLTENHRQNYGSPTTRFCKNLGKLLHMRTARLDPRGSSQLSKVVEWCWEEAESMIGNCLDRWVPVAPLHPDVLKDRSEKAFVCRSLGGEARSSPAHQRARNGISRHEVDLCEEILGITCDKYRCYKARVLCGLACISIQNERGTNTTRPVRRCHPAFASRHKGEYTKIEINICNIQHLCEGIDVRLGNAFARVFQHWEWIPNMSALSPVFPRIKAIALMRMYKDWDSKSQIRNGIKQWEIPLELQMVIGEEDMQPRCALADCPYSARHGSSGNGTTAANVSVRQYHVQPPTRAT